MSNIRTSAAQLIGRTPLLELGNIVKKEGLRVRLLATFWCYQATQPKERQSQ